LNPDGISVDTGSEHQPRDIMCKPGWENPSSHTER
jgi:hypothetical protein